jgi:hypothetical protein
MIADLCSLGWSPLSNCETSAVCNGFDAGFACGALTTIDAGTIPRKCKLRGSVRNCARDRSGGACLAAVVLARGSDGWDRDELCALWIGSGGGAAGGHRTWLPAVPLPRLREAVQRAQRWGAEPELPAERHHRFRGGSAGCATG